MEFKKKLDFRGLSTLLNCFLLALVPILLDDLSERKNCLLLWIFFILLLVVLLSFWGSLYYRLVLEGDSLIEKRLFHKKRVVAASSVSKVLVSLHGRIRIELKSGEKIPVCCMQDMDGLWLKLLEWVGKDRVEFAAGTTL